jgi:hypothetical protein
MVGTVAVLYVTCLRTGSKRKVGETGNRGGQSLIASHNCQSSRTNCSSTRRPNRKQSEKSCMSIEDCSALLGWMNSPKRDRNSKEKES